jgi:hypothetical protein
MTDTNDFFQKYYGQLVGCTIQSFTQDPNDEDSFPKFTLTRQQPIEGALNEIEIEVSRDEEGNGPGFLFINNQKGNDNK